MKKIISMILTAVIFCGLFTGCTVEAKDSQDEGSEYHLYYLNAGETDLKTAAYVPDEETTDFMVKDLMQNLEKQESDIEMLSLLPDGVSVNSYDLQEDLLVIDFNRRYLNISRAREILTRVGIVNTFLQIPDINRVRFTVVGEALTDSKNNEIGDMTENTFLEYNGENMDEYRYDTFTLYFTDKTGENLVEEKRNVYYKRTLSKERVVMEQLAKGPMIQGNYPTVPDGVQTISVKTADRICYVDVDRSFRDSALEISEQIPIYSVVNSILASCEADKVQISIAGSSEGTFGQTMPLYNFYERNDELVVAADEIVDVES